MWASVLTHLDPRFGGLSAAVPELSRQISLQSGCEVRLAAFCSPDEVYSADCFSELEITEWPLNRRRWLVDRHLRQTFSDLIATTSGVHIHGLWEQSTLSASHAAQRCGVPYIVSAHGMLESWALRQKAIKKEVYAALFERKILDRAACLHALTPAEADDYRRFGCTAPIATIPNGVTVPNHVTPDLFLGQHPGLIGKRIILFLSRIHKKKGVELLVESWRDVVRRFPDARLVLAGPDFDGTRSLLECKIAELGLGSTILLPGMLREELKWSALAAAEGYVLPSFSEGLSVSVLEAMGVGLPVIISHPCNLPEVETLSAGCVITADVASLRAALLRLLGRSPEANASIGKRGRTYVMHHFNWASIASDMTDLYRWISQGGDLPTTLDQIKNPAHGRTGIWR